MQSPHTTVSTDRIAFSSLISGAYASAAVALMFLAVDALRGNPLLTPSLIGSVALLGESPGAVRGVRLDMVALYSLLHFTAFAALGLGATLLHVRERVLRDHPVLLGALVFAVLNAAAALVDAVLFPGLVQAIGMLPTSFCRPCWTSGIWAIFLNASR